MNALVPKGSLGSARSKCLWPRFGVSMCGGNDVKGRLRARCVLRVQSAVWASVIQAQEPDQLVSSSPNVSKENTILLQGKMDEHACIAKFATVVEHVCLKARGIAAHFGKSATFCARQSALSGPKQSLIAFKNRSSSYLPANFT